MIKQSSNDPPRDTGRVPNSRGVQLIGALVVSVAIVGFLVGVGLEPKISNSHYTSCTQCHVESISASPAVADAPFAENQLAGRSRSGPGRSSHIRFSTDNPTHRVAPRGLHELPRPGGSSGNPHTASVAFQLHPMSRTVCHGKSAALCSNKLNESMTADLPAGLDNGHAIPEMREANLSVKDLQQLFADLEARTRILGVHEKVGRTEHSGPSVVDLDDVRTRLIAVTLPAAQIRCAFDVHEWTDTLIATREGMRLVRC